jgi:hypothetical protein
MLNLSVVHNFENFSPSKYFVISDIEIVFRSQFIGVFIKYLQIAFNVRREKY